MYRTHIFKWIIGLASALAIALAILSNSEHHGALDAKTTEIAIRDIGNQILLAQADSVSLVPPIKRLNAQTFELSFVQDIDILPKYLVDLVKNSFQMAGIREFYIVEVYDCGTGEVVYSYKIQNDEERNIIPCSGRRLEKACYSLQFYFFNEPNISSNPNYKFVLGLLGFLGLTYSIRRKVKNNSKSNTVPDIDVSTKQTETSAQEIIKIANLQFFPDQNLLESGQDRFSLSNKECELLLLLVGSLNQVIKREELTKKVWEDNGVVVGRSLDTYISKLRKKLQTDPKIQLLNVHAVGYKLVVED